MYYGNSIEIWNAIMKIINDKVTDNEYNDDIFYEWAITKCTVRNCYLGTYRSTQFPQIFTAILYIKLIYLHTFSPMYKQSLYIYTYSLDRKSVV